MRKLQKKTKSATPPQRPSRFAYTFKIGWFTALNVKLEEVAINEVVLRIPLPPDCKEQKKQSRNDVSPVKPTMSSSMSRKPDKKLIHRSSTLSKNSSSTEQNPRKRSAEQSSVSSSVNDRSAKTSKRRHLSVNKSKESLSKQQSMSENSSDSKSASPDSVQRVKHLGASVSESKETLSQPESLVKSPPKQSSNLNPEPKHNSLPVNDSESSSSKLQNSAKNLSKHPHLRVNGNKNSSSTQRGPSKSVSKQLSKRTKCAVKGAIKRGQKSHAVYIVRKDENFANKLRQKLKQLVHIPSLSSSQIKLTVDFEKLSNLVLHMKLPSADWRVTVLMNRDLSLVFEFTNKTSLRHVRFSETHCNICVSGKAVILLGCPKTVDSVKDIEILLEIVDKLNLEDCMVITSS
ncbi:hypothetical protein Zmor_010785 [Zophobas morio]|uniref:Uncharacterized protein n=1 Tax=Zophobas morio TaxID=2755281 RepID=A0AA38MK81_9CUCU|nr:hypothetical protein Zmor_010785 [Zophobas morio]